MVPTASPSSLSSLSLLLASLLVVGCGGGGGGGTDVGAPATAASSPTASNSADPGVPSMAVSEAALSAYALWSDALSSTPLTLTFRQTGSTAPEVRYFDGLPGGTGTQRRHALYDDGSHGDAAAADGIWTLTFTLDVAEPTALRLYDGQVDALTLTVGTPQDERNLELGVVGRVLDGTVAATTLDTKTTVTDAAVYLVEPGFDGQTLADVTERLYGIFPDDPFDFVVVFHGRLTGDGVPRSRGVRNDVDGINVGRFDTSAAYGSAGRLQQVVFQNARVTGREVNHELGHRWGAFLNDPALDLSHPTGFHWGVSDHVGVMGNGPYLLNDGSDGFLVTNAHGSEQFISNVFSPLELYLMGLAEPGEVAPIRFVTDSTVATPFGATLAETDTRLVSIADIVAVYGDRTPSSAISQKAFTAAFVMITDRAVSDAELTLTTHIARYAAGTSTGGVRGGGLFELLDPPSFAVATGFRASLETQLPPR